ncbi:glycoside hydrolase superfamily, partial [Kockiozyma suomiensis]|uniref:glycoside hydrolase superfamily n=1 Tax=Kockiozyma suomiensis TaxID=1337062 RepID=UPI0033430222
MRLLHSLIFTLFISSVAAYSTSARNNVAVYWGQASAGSQQSLATYCESDDVDIIILSFLTTFFASDNLPEVNFAGACSDTFSGTTLLKCDQIASDISTCQSKGKKVLLSLGGAVGTYGFTDDSQASDFATTLWNIFGGGTSDYRPFGSSIVDGFDLDIENNNPTGYAAFVTQMRNLYSGGDYYISAAPQCPFPDASVGDALDNAWFDFVFIQFYNNNCGVNSPSTFNYGTDWMTWVSSTAQNSNVKLYVGVPGSSTAAGSGYVTPDSLGTLLSGISDKSSLGGVMIWDASQAFANEVDGTTFAAGIKSMLNNIGDSPTEATSTAATSRIAETSSQAAAIDTIIFSSTQAQNLFLVPSTSSDTAPTSTAVLTSTEAVPAAATTESLTVPTSAGAESPTSITLETTSTI